MKVALHALQKQSQILNYKEVLILATFALSAGLLRVPMQVMPSVEPITFFAVLAGMLFGKYKGAVVGASALYISNFFVIGGHGPWTVFQVVGFAVAGYVGGLFKPNYVGAIGAMTLGTVAFELIVNSGSLFFLPTWTIFITAIPFMAAHIISNFIFSFGIPRARRFIHENGGFDERAITNELIGRLSRKSKRNS